MLAGALLLASPLTACVEPGDQAPRGAFAPPLPVRPPPPPAEPPPRRPIVPDQPPAPVIPDDGIPGGGPLVSAPAPLPDAWSEDALEVLADRFQRRVVSDEDVVGFAPAPSGLLAATATGGLFRSAPRVGWQTMPTDLPPLRRLFAIGGAALACPADGGVARVSADGGESWARLDAPCGAGGRRTADQLSDGRADAAVLLTRDGLRIGPLVGGVVLTRPSPVPAPRVVGAGKRMLVVFGDRGAAVSRDGGLTFVPASRPAQRVLAEPRDLAVGGKGEAVVVGRALGDWPGIVHSRDGGESWQPASAPPRVGADLAAVVVDATGVFLAVPVGDGDALRSVDGGQTWQPVATARSTRGAALALDRGFIAATARGIAVGVERSAPFGPGLDRPLAEVVFTHPRVAVASGVLGGLWRSVDGGRSWALAPSTGSLPFPGLGRIKGHGVMAVGDGRFWRSIDAGHRWDARTPPESCRARWTRFDGARGLAGCADARRALSEDGGLSWRIQGDGPAIRPLVWRADGLSGVGLSPDGTALHVTLDGGFTFAAVPSPTPLVELRRSGDALSALAEDGRIGSSVDPAGPWRWRAPPIDTRPATHRALPDGRALWLDERAVWLADADGDWRRMGSTPGARAVALTGDGGFLVLQATGSTLFEPR